MITPTIHTKIALRKFFLNQRKNLSQATATEWSAQICDQLLDYIPASGQTLHIFLPIAHLNEVNIWPFLKYLWAQHPAVKTCASVADFDNTTMPSYYVQASTDWQTNRWGIPEPNPFTHQLCPAERISMVLVPLVAFDKRGHRVGYGKGFYDRFLATCQPNVVKIGLSFFDPVEIITDVQPNDIGLDYCICPNKTWSFKQEINKSLG